MVSWRAKWKNCFLATTHGLLPSPSYKTFFPDDAGLVTCCRRLASQNTCSFVAVIHTFFQSMQRIQDSVHVHDVICPAVRGEGRGGRGKSMNKSVPKNVNTDWIIIICLHYVNTIIIISKIYIALLSINDQLHASALTYMSINVAGFNRKYHRHGHVVLRLVAY